MALLKYLKMARAMMREEAQLNRDMRKLVKSELDYGALQRMVDSAAYRGVQIEIKMSDKTIVIKPAAQARDQATFFDKYVAAQRNNY